MHVHFSYHRVSRNPQLDRTVRGHVRKLERLLVRFSPDLAHLRGTVEFSAAHQGPVCSLNLWLPTAQLHAKEEGGSALAAVQVCFNQLLEQVKRHKQVLRREGVWKRRRFKFLQEAKELQSGELRVADRQQMRDYLDQVLPQLERFIARELRYQELAGVLLPGQSQVEEVVNEVVVRALENVKAVSLDSVPFHRLVSEVLRVLDSPLCKPAAVGHGDSARTSSPDSSGPEVAAAERRPQSKSEASKREEETPLFPHPVDLCLASLPTVKRQVYVLHALEGFSWEETAQVLGRSVGEVQENFQKASQEVSATLGRAESPGELPAGAASPTQQSFSRGERM